MADAFARAGHRAKIWEPGIRFRGRFDLGIFAHLADTQEMLEHCDYTVGVCHGIVEPERPANFPVDRTAYVSENVAEHWDPDNPDPWIVRQPIDLNAWAPLSQDPADALERDNRLVRYSYRRPEFLAHRAASHWGLEFAHLNCGTREHRREVLGRARVVLATGRGALEALAVGAPVVFYDHRAEYQPPMISLAPLEEQIRASYSGRGTLSISNPSPAVLWTEVKVAVDAWREEPEAGIAWIRAHHDADQVADEFLEEAGR